MSNQIPGAPSSVRCPFLHVAGLPRLHEKYCLLAAGVLDPEWALGDGYDAMVEGVVGINRDAAAAYVKNSDADYLTFVEWVLENGKRPEKEEYDEHNAAVDGYLHDNDKVASPLRSGIGLDADREHKLTGGALLPNNAVVLNLVEDLVTRSRRILAKG